MPIKHRFQLQRWRLELRTDKQRPINCCNQVTKSDWSVW